jgi:dipeptidyl aminopeptidase/acylaminoacyl peptidase
VCTGSFTEPVKLTDHNPQVKDLALGRGEVIRWRSKDGMEIEGLLIHPVGFKPGQRYPLLAGIHGGPSGVWTQNFPAGWGNYAHVWAGKGWLVFLPNVRGSSGYGEKLLLANVRDWGGGDFQDIQTGLDDLVERGIADPDKLGQTGWSYGGYMTAWTLTQTPRFKAVMVGAGLTNMFSMYSTNDLQRILEGYFGAAPWNDLEAYRRASAMSFIKQAKTPTLIMHGSEDKRVPIGQAQELYMGLRKNNVPVQMVLYPREGHGLSEPRHQLDKMRREYAWFAKHVLGKETKKE